ncbi:MAG: EamA family transporter [Actinomycetota bacterium]|nr:EamA family transporter [Actinomycetota bacterium]
MKRTGYFLVLGAIVLFSTIEVVSKYLQSGQGAAGEVGTTQVAALRFFLGTLFLVLLMLRPGQPRIAVKALKDDGLHILVLGAVGVFLTFLLFHLGVEKTEASVAAVLFSMNPVFTVLVAYFALGERLGIPGWIGVAVGLLGAFTAITGFEFSGLFGREDFLGGALMLLSALCWAFYTVYGKKYSERYGGLVVSFTSMAVGSLLFVLLLTFQGGWAEMGDYSARAWMWLVYLGVITVGIGYILYFEGMRRIPASRGASLFYLKPILALLFAYFALGEPIYYTLILASVMVAAGVLLVTLPRERARPEAVGNRRS